MPRQVLLGSAWQLWAVSLLLFCGFQASTTAAGQAILKIVDFQSWYFRAEIAEFGLYLEPNMVYPANLMTPPEDPRLCEFSESLFEHVNNTSVEIIAPVGLLISHGACNPLDKIRVAMDMQQKVPDVIKFIIMYNNDPDNPDDIVSLRPPSDRLSSDEFGALGLISVSTVSGGAILKRMDDLSNKTGLNPHILQPMNQGWEMKAEFSRVLDQRPSRNDLYVNPGANPSSFYWFRLVLFTLLIVSPCCRAGYLWWAGGGRVRLRYNERGRLVGFQYIPPISDWFVSTGIHVHGTPLTERLTEDQVLALPEITFKPHLGFEADDVEDCAETVDEQLDEREIVIGCGSADEGGDSAVDEEPKFDALSTPTSSADDDDDEEQPRRLALNSENHETTCTTCSICIDDFEVGERIRVLPRCKHAFHTDCIMPWLTERQGCCPLCKTDVLGVENNENEVIETPENAESTGEQNAQHPVSRGVQEPTPDSESLPAVTAIRIVSNVDNMAAQAPAQTVEENVIESPDKDTPKESVSAELCNLDVPTNTEISFSEDDAVKLSLDAPDNETSFSDDAVCLGSNVKNSPDGKLLLSNAVVEVDN